MHTGFVPGARLTHDERRRIAAWLTEGHGYAEIARRLGRPTSTISREVARNGVPGDYLPDHAHQTAGRRARRRAPGRGAQPAPDQASNFTELFAESLTTTGFPRMGARVFASLLTSGGLTAADLVRRLQVSPASISKSIGYLQGMSLVVRTRDGRRERYTVVDDVWLRAWRTDTGGHARVASVARQGISVFGAGSPAGRRLAQAARFFGWLSRQMHVVDDALTVLAALVHADRSLDVGELAEALGWPRARVAEAVHETGDRLTAEQRMRLK
jgi:DNA-binding transcriptional regulator GbsR (MarR family)